MVHHGSSHHQPVTTSHSKRVGRIFHVPSSRTDQRCSSKQPPTTQKEKQCGQYPLVNVYSLLLKMAIEIVDLSVKNGDFP